MNNEEAKLILQAYRPGGQDSSDPRFREALEQARRDPELAKWFSNERALDSRISISLRKSIAPPAQLKSQLLAQRRLVRPVVWFKQPRWRIAIAACLALMLTFAAMWLKPDATRFDLYRTEMADFTGNKLDRLDLISADIMAVRRWLAQEQGHGDLLVPDGLNGRPTLGCRVLEWKGHKVSLVCFELANREVAHLVVVDSSAFDDPPGDSPAPDRTAGVATVSWSHAGKTYLITSKTASQGELLRLM